MHIFKLVFLSVIFGIFSTTFSNGVPESHDAKSVDMNSSIVEISYGPNNSFTETLTMDAFIDNSKVDTVNKEEKMAGGAANAVWIKPNENGLYYIPVRILLNLDFSELLARILQYISQNTNLRFYIRKEEQAYIKFLYASDGTSHSTLNGGVFSGCDIAYAAETYVSVILHEILHCLGFSHEDDRTDQYLNANMSEIDKPSSVIVAKRDPNDDHPRYYTKFDMSSPMASESGIQKVMNISSEQVRYHGVDNNELFSLCDLAILNTKYPGPAKPPVCRFHRPRFVFVPKDKSDSVSKDKVDLCTRQYRFYHDFYTDCEINGKDGFLYVEDEVYPNKNDGPTYFQGVDVIRKQNKIGTGIYKMNYKQSANPVGGDHNVSNSKLNRDEEYDSELGEKRFENIHDPYRCAAPEGSDEPYNICNIFKDASKSKIQSDHLSRENMLMNQEVKVKVVNSEQFNKIFHSPSGSDGQVVSNEDNIFSYLSEKDKLKREFEMKLKNKEFKSLKELAEFKKRMKQYNHNILSMDVNPDYSISENGLEKAIVLSSIMKKDEISSEEYDEVTRLSKLDYDENVPDKIKNKHLICEHYKGSVKDVSCRYFCFLECSYNPFKEVEKCMSEFKTCSFNKFHVDSEPKKSNSISFSISNLTFFSIFLSTLSVLML